VRTKELRTLRTVEQKMRKFPEPKSSGWPVRTKVLRTLRTEDQKTNCI
jgi:hypothetical protein